MKIRNNVPLSKEEEPRNVWPFVTMKVNAVCEIENRKEWPQISKYAHSVASKKKWKFSTIWLKKENVGRIRRIA